MKLIRAVIIGVLLGLSANLMGCTKKAKLKAESKLSSAAEVRSKKESAPPVLKVPPTIEKTNAEVTDSKSGVSANNGANKEKASSLVPKFVLEHFLGKSKEDFEKANGNLVSSQNEWCGKIKGCKTFRKDNRVVGGVFFKEYWVEDGIISIVDGSLDVYPSQLLNQTTVGDSLDKDEVAPQFIQAVMTDGGQTVVAIWEFDRAEAKIVAHCPGGMRNGKLVAKNFRNCILTKVWMKQCKKDEACKFAESYRVHDSEF